METRESGYALVIVLWVVILGSAIAASFAKGAWTESQVVRTMSSIAQAEALADAGFYRAMKELIRPAKEGPWRGDGSSYGFALANGTIVVSMQDETGKVDLNYASERLLRNLFLALEVDDNTSARLAAAIVDYRDANDEAQPLGAESRDYASAGMGHVPANRNFATTDELLRVMGISNQIFRRVRPFVTIHSRSGSINETVAPRAVILASRDNDESSVDEILASRASYHEMMDGAGSLDNAVTTSMPMTGQDPVFTIRAEATTEGGAKYTREAVVALTPNGLRPYKTLAWRQLYNSQAAP